MHEKNTKKSKKTPLGGYLGQKNDKRRVHGVIFHRNMLDPPIFHFDPDLVFGRFDALKRPPLVLKCREIESIVLKKGQKGSFFVFFRVFWVFSCFFVLECRGRLFWLDFSTIIWRVGSTELHLRPQSL